MARPPITKQPTPVGKDRQSVGKFGTPGTYSLTPAPHVKFGDERQRNVIKMRKADLLLKAPALSAVLAGH